MNIKEQLNAYFYIFLSNYLAIKFSIKLCHRYAASRQLASFIWPVVLL